MIVTLQEDPIQKNKSYKALASARWLNDDGTLKKVKGDLTIYFQKDSTIKNYKYGQQLVFQKELQNIQNAGNPGGFDYKRFCLFQDITHQVYLKTNEFILPAYYIKRWKPYLDQQ